MFPEFTLFFEFYSNRVPVSVVQMVAITVPPVLKTSTAPTAVYPFPDRLNSICRLIVCLPVEMPSAPKRKN